MTEICEGKQSKNYFSVLLGTADLQFTSRNHTNHLVLDIFQNNLKYETEIDGQ